MFKTRVQRNGQRKNITIVAMMILLKSPYPNHTTSKGAKAKIGMACDMTRKGVIAASTLGKLNMTIARGIDMARLDH